MSLLEASLSSRGAVITRVRISSFLGKRKKRGRGNRKGINNEEY